MPTITIVVPALNEERNIEEAIKKAIRLAKSFSAYEIIAIDDGSIDKTGEIIERMKEIDRNIITIHHSKPMGLGYTYKDGLRVAKNEYYALVAGDNEEEEDAQHALFSKVGDADITLAYPMNTAIRPLDRQFVSNSFTAVVNLLFGLKLPYYTGGNVIKTDLLRNVPTHTSGFAYMPSIIVRLVRSGHSYKPVGITLKKSGKTNVYKLSNIRSVIKELVRLFMEVNVTDRKKYAHIGKMCV